MRILNIISILVISILTLTGIVSGIIDQDIMNNTENINNQTNINNTEDIEEDTDQPITFIEKFNTQVPEETIVSESTKTPGFEYILSMIVIISIVYVFRIRKT